MTNRFIDEQEIEETYRRFYPIIKAKCTRMLRNRTDAQDLAQETFVRLWERRKSLRNNDAKLAWIYKTSTHLVVDHIRRKDLAKELTLYNDKVHIDPSRKVEFQKVLEKIVQVLTTRELEAIILCRIDGLTHKEIGTIMGLSDRSIRRLLRKADECLKDVEGRLF